MREHVIREPGNAKRSPTASLPAWKVIALGLGSYGLLAGFSLVVLQLPPKVPLAVSWAISAVVFVLGICLTLWSWRQFHWLARLGHGILLTLVLLASGVRFWAALLSGTWLWVVLLLVVALYALAWTLPAVSTSLSGVLWEEQTVPRTMLGRNVMRWALGLGLGGAGVIGASVGTSLARTGGARLAYCIVALATSALAIGIAQGFSHQLWPDSPWGKPASILKTHKEA